MRERIDFDQLPAKINEAEEMRNVSDDAFRQSLASWYLAADTFGPIPKDPYSEEFRAFQLSIYQQLAQQSYQTENEAIEFDFDQELLRPYPYATQSFQTVGHHLTGLGWLIEKMSLPPGSEILEIGSGYGSLTVHLANMGYKVTCLDINERLLAFIKARTENFLVPIKTICGDMATVEIDGEFDAVIFNASFHHSLEHEWIIQRLDSVLSPKGLLVFVTEPVVSRFSSAVPYPWGIRLDGLSVWSIHKWGWLELGFQQAYFIQMLKAEGWKLSRHDLGFSPQTDIWIATKANQPLNWLRWVQSAVFGYEFDLETGMIRLVKKVSRGFQAIGRLLFR